MISTPFEYKRASSIEDALAALNDDSKILAGGHSLIPALKLRLNQTDTLIDITRIEALKRIKMDGNIVSIGACATHTDIIQHADVMKHAALLAMVGSNIGDVQIRNVGTIGGSLAHADPAADWPAAVIAADAVIRVQGKHGVRDIAAADFFTGIYSTDLGADEIITEIRVASMDAKSVSYQKFPQPASRFALVGCAVAADTSSGSYSDARIAFTGVADSPYCDRKAQAAIEGKPIGDPAISDAVGALDTSVYVMSDHYANEDYRMHLAGVMLSRALKALA